MESKIRNPFSRQRIPWLAELHRNAFRSGRSDVPEVVKFASRLAFYVGRTLWPRRLPGEIGVAFDGGRRTFEFDARNRMFSAVYFDKFATGYEPPVMALVDALTPDDGTFFDIGSNWGYYSVFLASRPDFRGRIHAFEPWPATFRDLASVVRQLQLEEVVTRHNFALGAGPQSGGMQCGSHSGCAKLSGETGGVTVAIQALDDLGLPAPEVMKVDTEGHEEQVFRGARKTLAKARPMIIFEHRYELLLDEADQLTGLQLLESLGYRLFIPHWNGKPGHDCQQEPIPACEAAVRAEGLRLLPCSSATRRDHPDCPDLLACPNEKVELLRQRGWLCSR